MDSSSDVNVNVLAVSVGNTRTRLGAFLDGVLTETEAVSNSEQEQIDQAIDRLWSPLGNREALALISSVNPPIGEKLEHRITQKIGQNVRLVERDLPIPVGRQLDRDSKPGQDRLLNAAAAYDVLGQSCIVVDLGTALTVDFIDGAGTFHGGAIVPGANLMLDSLAQGAAQIPEIEFKRPQEPIGHCTRDAARTGVFHGLRGIVRELVETYAEHAGQFPMVVATGGDSDTVFGDYDLVDRLVPDLTLQGIALTLRTALEQARKESG